MLQANVSAPRPFRKHQPRDEDPDRPAGEHQVERRTPRARGPSAHRLKPKNQIASSVTGTMPIASRTMLMIISASDELGGAQRRDHQVAEVARVHLFEERDREAELPAEQDVPQQHGADQHAARLREQARLLRQIGLQEAPHQHLHGRPVDQLGQARPRRAQQIPIAQHHRGDAARRERRMRARRALIAPPRGSRPRATSRNTSSSVSRP